MNRIFHIILNYVFPTQCIVCTKPGPDICDECIGNLHAPKISNYEWIISLWDYHDKRVEKIMRHIKNIPNNRIAQILAHKAISRLRNEPICKQLSKTIIVPIPIGRARFRSRGYNQSLLLARPIAALLRRPINQSVLIKNRQTKKQGTTGSRDERLVNILGSFSVPQNQIHTIFERDILIIDDITTTGSTLLEARKTLLDAGARRVIAVTIAN